MVQASDKIRSSKISIWRKIKSSSASTVTQLAFPEPQHCITHLKLLRALTLKKNELSDTHTQRLVNTVSRPETSGQDQSHKVKESDNHAWQIYLERASGRFDVWWKSMAAKDGHGHMAHIDMSLSLQPGKLETLLRETRPKIWTEKNLPPLDVLMLLHSFMLNPRCFLEDCIRFGMLPLWKAGMPWKLLERALDNPMNEYLVSPGTKKSWEIFTGLPWDVQEVRRTIPCPICEGVVKLEHPPAQHSGSEMAPPTLKHNSGNSCKNCDNNFSDEQLQLYKLRTSIINLRQHNIPLPGTILTIDGLAQSAAKTGEDPPIFALNRLLQGEVGNQILTLTDLPSSQSTSTCHPTITSIRETLTTAISNSTTSLAPSRPLLASLHRFILQHKSNSTPFSLSLPAAVTRQFTFTSQMHTISWLNSPSLTYTMSTLLSRYKTFFRILAENPTKVAVPTHAVDLAWHTHQLSPASYYEYSTSVTNGVFIDHDDRIEEGVRTDAFEWTGKEYKRICGEEYSACLCWVCATALAITAPSRSALMAAHKLPLTEHGHVHFPPDSALEIQVLTQVAAKQHEKLEEDYAVASRRGREVDKSVFLQEYGWLYPMAVPVLTLSA